jgi:large repetitive protein
VTGRAARLALAGTCAALLVLGPPRGTSAAFTTTLAIGGNEVTADKLGNYFRVTPGTAVQPGTSTPIATGSVDTLALDFGLVPSARTFTSVFTVTNVSAQAQTAVLTASGPAQVSSLVFAATGTTSVTLAAGASTAVTATTSATVAGRGTGTLRLALSGVGWLYREYPVSIDEAPEAPPALSAAARAGGRVDLAWTASSTTTNLGGYDVYRANGGGPYAKLNGSLLAGTSYSDTATADGTTYTYVVRAVSSGSPTLTSVDSPSATATADATPPGRPTAIALANGGGAGGAYASAANSGSLSVSVTLPAGSLATDTVQVTLANGGGSIVKTTSGSAGAGTVTVGGINASSLAEGSFTVTAISTDAAGNVSSSFAATFTKDTIAPGAPTGVYTDVKQNVGADTIGGTAEAGAAIRAQQTQGGSGTYGPVTATGGSYTLAVLNAKSVTVTYKVTATDAAGNASAATTVGPIADTK